MQKLPFPGESPGAHEREMVEHQLGRPVRGSIGIAARCRYGLPAAVRTSPRLDDGTPFPTLFYLTCPVAVRDIGRLEASGLMDEMRAELDGGSPLVGEMAEAHERYLRLRDSLGVLDTTMSAGGMPERIKCLHALYAHELGDDNPVGRRVAERIEPIDCPGLCVADLGEGMQPVPGHPGFKGRRAKR